VGRHARSDYYVTPEGPIRDFLLALCELEHNILNSRILDPCAGGDAQHDMSYPKVIAGMNACVVPRRRQVIQTVDTRKDSKAQVKADYLSAPASVWFGEPKPYFIVTNPPFLLAEQIIRKALADVAPGGFVGMLLRLNFFGSRARMPLWKEYMPKYVFVHPIRISFTGDGKTDSIEHCHMVWQQGWKGTTSLYVLQENKKE